VTKAPVNDVEFGRGEAGLASLELPNDTVPLAVDRVAEDSEEVLDNVEPSGGFVGTDAPMDVKPLRAVVRVVW
jgi:hypothetical protein